MHTTMHKRILFTFLAAASCLNAQTDLRGIYIYTNDVSQVTKATATQLTQSFSIPGVDGVALVIGWDAIEPAKGQFDWTLLDQWIGQIVALGKKIDLVVPAGGSMPSWLFQPLPAGAGAVDLNFTITPHGGQTSVCQTVDMAAPWDPAFLTQWDLMLAALAAHLKAAGTYKAITLVRITGVNRTTEELRLPNQTAEATGLACVTDAIATWQKAGYRPSLLLQGWNAILASFMKSFPDKPFAVSIIVSGAFPAIGEDGSVIKGPVGDQTQPLLLSASQKLPGRLVVQFDFLMPGEAASTYVTDAAKNLGTMAAYQTNEYLGGQGAACSEPVTNPTPCTASTYLTLLDTGVYPLGQSNPLRSQYIEVFHDNAAAFPDDVLTAHYQLIPPAISLVANAEGESPTIAPNTWVEIKGVSLEPPGFSSPDCAPGYCWQGSDFVGGKMPTQLDNVGVTVNGKNAFVYYISPSQVNILTPPDAISGAVQIVATNGSAPSASFTAQAAAIAPSFFVFNGGPYLAATHVGGALIGPATLFPKLTTPAKPNETIVLYANGFGPTSTPVVSGSILQSGSLSPLPMVKIGGVTATVQFAGLVAPGEFQFNVVVPANTPDGDQPIVATYNGTSTQAGTLITIQH
jgi:uncharacterized protein (TIGR03437 family)